MPVPCLRSEERKAQSYEERILRAGTRVGRGVDGTASGQKDLQAVGERLGAQGCAAVCQELSWAWRAALGLQSWAVAALREGWLGSGRKSPCSQTTTLAADPGRCSELVCRPESRGRSEFGAAVGTDTGQCEQTGHVVPGPRGVTASAPSLPPAPSGLIAV